MITKARLLRQGFIVMSGLIALGLWKLLAIWALARWLGPTIQGAFSLALAGMAFGAVVFSLGCDYANAFLVGRQSTRSLRIVWNSIWITFLTGLLAPLWTMGFVKAFPQTLFGLGSLRWLGISLIAASTVFLSLQQELQAATVGLERYDLVARANFLSGAVWAVGAVIAVHVSYVAVLLAWTLSTVAVLFYYLNIQGGAITRPFAIDLQLLRKQLHYGIRTVPGGIARSLNMRAALYLCSAYLSPSDVGIYGLLLTLAETMLYLPNALGQVILGTSAAHDTPGRDFRSFYATLAFIGLAASVFVFVFGPQVLSAVFSPAYAVGASALGILLLAVTVHSLGLIRLNHLYGIGDPMAGTTGQLTALVLTLAGGWLLIPRWGIMGAAVATLITYVGFSTYLLWIHRPKLRGELGIGRM